MDKTMQGGVVVPIRLTLCMSAAACVCALAACASPGPEEKVGPRQMVATDAFADPAVVREPAAAPAYPNAAPMYSPPTPTSDMVAIAGTPEVPPLPVPPAPRTDPIPADATVIVDEMVGQINGEPVYAEEFFRDMDARLRTESTQKTLRQWIKDVRADVEAKLWDVMRDELLLAEFRSTLTPEMKIGVQYFIQDLQRQLTSEAGGSREQANEQSLAAEGMTIGEKVKDESQRMFVLQQLRKAISNRVHVTSRDIETYYDQNYEKFNPPSVAVFAVIRVPLSDPGRIKRVEQRLAAGDEFAAIAAIESDFEKAKDNRMKVVLEADAVEGQTIWAIEELNLATQKLTPGRSTERINARNFAWWVMLLEIEHPPGRSLYDAQLEIAQILRNERMKREELRYFERLLAKSNVSDMQTMATRLVNYAAVRYYVRPPEAAKAK